MHRLALPLLLILFACEDSTGGSSVIVLPGVPDGRVAPDALLVADGAPRDATPPADATFDAATLDAATLDAATLDATPPDAQPLDAQPPDAQPLDALSVDAQPLDALPIDALPIDAGPACGDGVQTGVEACDDGNALDGDYCAADCRSVTGRCGDGVLQNIERCDDGRIVEGCDRTHDGGDGSCVPLGACVDGYVLEADICVPVEGEAEIEIFVANDCTMRVDPPSFDVARGRTMTFTYRNRSRDYPVDVWLSYGGGFLDLPIGQAWPDRFVHCAGPRRPRQAWADISTACSEHRFLINCL